MNAGHSKWIIAGTLALAATTAFAEQVTLYERPDFQGRYAVANDGVAIVANQGFGNTAASIVVTAGRWEVCTDAYFRGRCTELVPGSYPGIDVRLDGRIASAREIGYAASSTPIAISPQIVVNPPPSAADMRPIVVNPPPVTVNAPAGPAPIGRALLYEDPNRILGPGEYPLLMTMERQRQAAGDVGGHGDLHAQHHEQLPRDAYLHSDRRPARQAP